MSRLAHISTSVPDHKMSGAEVERYAEIVCERWGIKAATVIRIIKNAKVNTRYTVQPIEELLSDQTFKERNDLFIEKAVEMGEAVIRKGLDAAQVDPTEIDMLFTVSCTGFMIPSLDAYLIPRLGMKPTTRRVPITELGCAAGAVGLSRCHEYVKAYPKHKALLLAVELPTLTFQPGDPNMANVVSAVIFGDGAAAALVCGEEAKDGLKTPGPQILETRSFIFPESLWYMGFNIDGDGLHIVLDKKVPLAIQQTIHPLVTEFLADNGLTLKDIKWAAMHPAGKKPIGFMENELGFDRSMTQYTWSVLNNYGNMSSASVLFVLKEMLEAEEAPAQDGDLGVILAFGPGFSAELLLARWEA